MKKIQKILANKLEETARELKQQMEEMTKRAYQAEVLFQMSLQLQEINSRERLYEFIASILEEMFGARQVMIFEYESGQLIPVANCGIAEDAAQRVLSIDGKAIKSLIDLGDVIRVADIKGTALADFVCNIKRVYRVEPSLIINKFYQDKLSQLIVVGACASLKVIGAEDIKTLAVFIEHAAKIGQNLKLIESLEEEKDKLAMAVNNMSDGLIYTDTEMNIALLNDRAQEMLAEDKGINLGMNLYEVLARYNTDMRLEEVVVQQSDAKFTLSIPEEGIYYEALATKIKDDKGQITGMMVVVRDISEERYTSTLKSTFMATVSHKLRTPLTVIREGVSLLHENILGELNPKQQSAVAKAYNQTQYLTSLINSLLEFAKTEADIMALGLKKERMNLKEFFADLLLSLEKQYKEKNIIVNPEIDEAINIYVDRDKLQTAVGNILDNAVKFNLPGTKVDIIVRTEQDKVVLVIADNGAGIPRQGMKYIFKSFTQIDKDFTGQIKGMGLGLYLAFKIVQAHRGEIICESELGRGTRFIIKLPLV